MALRRNRRIRCRSCITDQRWKIFFILCYKEQMKTWYIIEGIVLYVASIALIYDTSIAEPKQRKSAFGRFQRR